MRRNTCWPKPHLVLGVLGNWDLLPIIKCAMPTLHTTDQKTNHSHTPATCGCLANHTDPTEQQLPNQSAPTLDTPTLRRWFRLDSSVVQFAGCTISSTDTSHTPFSVCVCLVVVSNSTTVSTLATTNTATPYHNHDLHNLRRSNETPRSPPQTRRIDRRLCHW